MAGGVRATRGFHPFADSDRSRWIDARKALGSRGDPLFRTLDGKPLSAVYVRNLFKRLANAAGIENRVQRTGYATRSPSNQFGGSA